LACSDITIKAIDRDFPFGFRPTAGVGGFFVIFFLLRKFARTFIQSVPVSLRRKVISEGGI